MAKTLDEEIRDRFPKIVGDGKWSGLGFINTKDLDEIDKNGGADVVVLYFGQPLNDADLKEEIKEFVMNIRPDTKQIIFYYWYP